MSDRVLVPMSRSEAEWYDALGEGTGHGPTHRPIRAALDTDREETIARIAELLTLEDTPWDETGVTERLWCRNRAARVLDALEQEASDV